MTNTQFDALVRLLRMKPDSRTCKASRSVFVDGLTMYAASKLHALSEPAVQESCKTIQRALKDCYTLFTGETPE